MSGFLDPKPLTVAALDTAVSGKITTPGSATATALSATILDLGNENFVPKGSTQVGLDTDGVPYFSDALAFTDAVPVLTDTDGVPYFDA
jgi:hypothetical protein